MDTELSKFALFHANICYCDLWYGESSNLNSLWCKLSYRYNLYQIIAITDILHEILIFNAL